MWRYREELKGMPTMESVGKFQIVPNEIPSEVLQESRHRTKQIYSDLMYAFCPKQRATFLSYTL